jgi:hypothetical protein
MRLHHSCKSCLRFSVSRQLQSGHHFKLHRDFIFSTARHSRHVLKKSSDPQRLKFQNWLSSQSPSSFERIVSLKSVSSRHSCPCCRARSARRWRRAKTTAFVRSSKNVRLLLLSQVKGNRRNRRKTASTSKHGPGRGRELPAIARCQRAWLSQSVPVMRGRLYGRPLASGRGNGGNGSRKGRLGGLHAAVASAGREEAPRPGQRARAWGRMTRDAWCLGSKQTGHRVFTLSGPLGSSLASLDARGVQPRAHTMSATVLVKRQLLFS